MHKRVLIKRHNKIYQVDSHLPRCPQQLIHYLVSNAYITSNTGVSHRNSQMDEDARVAN